MTRTVTVGQHVTFVDEDRVAHDALVTHFHGQPQWDDQKPLNAEYGTPEYNWPTCLNLVYVLKDDKRTDQYGSQTRHVSSVCHQSINTAGGYMWRFA